MNSISRLVWFVALLFGSIVSPFFGSLLKEWGKLSDTVFITLASTVALILTFGFSIVIFYDWYASVFQNWYYKYKKIYTDFVYSSVKVRLEYLNTDGSLVAFKRNDHIHKISLKRSRRMLRVAISNQGQIVRDQTSAINSAPTFPSEDTVAFQTYFDDDNLLGKQHFSTYACVFKDGFPGKSEFWTFSTQYYCNLYVLEVAIPKERVVKEAKLQRRLVKGKTKTEESDSIMGAGDEKKWELCESPKVAITYDLQRTVISTHITALRAEYQYRLVWTFVL